jgi:hypothetical protein
MKRLFKNPRRLMSAVALFIMALAGCETSIVKSSRLAPRRTGSGLAYFLPMGWLKLTVSMELISTTANPQVYHRYATSVTPEVMLAADRTAGYLLQITPSAAADDYEQLTVTNGLLQSVTMTNTDQTLGVLSNLTATVIGALRAAYFPLPGGAASNAVPPTYITNFVTNIYYIDPFAEAAAGNPEYSMPYADLVLHLGEIVPDAQNSQSNGAGPAISGVYYRALEPYKMSWDGADSKIHGETVAWLPNKNSLLSLSADRASGVKQSIAYLFQQGVPCSVTVNKPSQALAISSFPLTVLKQLTGLPTNLYPFNINLGGTLGSGSTNAATNQ